MYTFDRVAIKAEARQVLARQRGLLVGVTLAVLLCNAVLAMLSVGLLNMLLSGVVTVAASGFFLRVWQGGTPGVAELFTAMFDEGFLRKMGGMIWVFFKTFLYTLLLIVPGIIKGMAYALTPYILAEYPNVPAMEASRISERMMYGHKMDLFITMLSFIGWGMLSALTMNILYVLHVGPYMELTYAGIYDEIKRLALENGVVTMEELSGSY